MKMTRKRIAAVNIGEMQRISPHLHKTAMGGLTAFQGMALDATGRVTGLLTDGWDVAWCS